MTRPGDVLLSLGIGVTVLTLSGCASHRPPPTPQNNAAETRAKPATAIAPATRPARQVSDAELLVDPGHERELKLIDALERQDPDAALAAIRDGADIDYTPPWSRPTQALLLTTFRPEMADVAKALLERGADVNQSRPGGFTALHNACEWSGGEMVTLLLDHGANVNARDASGLTPLHIAARCRVGEHQRRVCETLIQRGAEVNALDAKGHTPLDMCRGIEADRVLRAHGGKQAVPYDAGPMRDRADSDVTFERSPDRPHLGPSPLHNACVWGDLRTVWLELRRGAGVNSRDFLGFMPLHIAAYGKRMFEDPQLCEMLLKHGADVNAADGHGRTPLDLARARHHDKTVALLERNGGRSAANLPSAER